MKLLDTTFLIHYWGGRESVEAYLDTHERCEFVTTTINIKEIAVGRALQNSLDPFEIRSAFDWLTISPFTAEHAFIAGELERDLHQNESINSDKINALAADVLIAAVAKEKDAVVVTRNTEDFSIFDGVSVETY